jgi:hypothetical protein
MSIRRRHGSKPLTEFTWPAYPRQSPAFKTKKEPGWMYVAERVL